MKVLLINDNHDGGYAAGDWVNTLKREGVPYDEVNTDYTNPGSVALPALSSTSSDGTTGIANYEGVIVANSGTSGLSTAQWTTLQTFEHDFSVRQVTAYTVPSSDTGMTYLGKTFSSAAVSATNDAVPTPTVTAAFATFFPYLNKVDLDPTTFGYEGTPGASDQSLLSGPNGSSLLGIYTSSDGRQTMYQTFSSNQYEVQSELLRHGELNWLARDTYFGDQRNYLETHIDDNFLSDDTWNTTTNSTDYNAADALREVPADVTKAASWETTNGYDNNFRIDMLFNGGGSPTGDALLTQFKTDKNSFGWINHTWDHPNLDQGCATQNYIEAEIQQNTNWASSTSGLDLASNTTGMLGTENPGVVVTGEHAGLANLIPGNPGTVDPPGFDDVPTASATTGNTLVAGTTYEYAIADSYSVNGPQSSASTTQIVMPTGDNTANLTWDAECHAAEYYIYRGTVSGTTVSWSLIHTENAGANDFIDPTTTTNTAGGGPIEKSYTDTGSSISAATTDPSTQANLAVETPYEQNQSLTTAFGAIGITDFGSDASKPYPNPAAQAFTTAPTGTTPAGATFSDGGATAIPRYPTNIYYNVSTDAQELSEYNYLYFSHCTNSSTTTCLTAPLTSVSQIFASIDQGMFQHMMGNDPRPHYFHQTNMMDQSTGLVQNQGTGLFYETVDPLLQTYTGYFNSSEPIEQLTMAQIGGLLNDQAAWATAAGNTVTGSIEGSVVTVKNTGAGMDIPLTGIKDVGSLYGGTQSGWDNMSGTKTYTALAAWPALPTTPVVVTLPTGPAPGAGTGTKPVTKAPAPILPPTGPVVPKKHVVSKPKPIAYVAVQVKPRTASISKKGDVTVSLVCKATKGKTAKNKLCAGSFTLTVAGHKLGHRFRFRSPKTHRFTVTLSTKVLAAASRTRRHHQRRMVGSLLIKTTQTHAKARQTRGTLTIRV